jgi:TrmH family RNA methyltransferase
MGWLDAAERQSRVYLVDDDTLARVAPTTTPQGLLAVVRVPQHRLEPAGVAVYLDRVQDPGNVGAVIRSAAAFGATGVACSPGCASPFSWRSLRVGRPRPAPAGPGRGARCASPTSRRRRRDRGGERHGGTLGRWQPRRLLLSSSATSRRRAGDRRAL